ncbi:MAG: O-antigen ligase family protein [Flavisolibacter sp.]
MAISYQSNSRRFIGMAGVVIISATFAILSGVLSATGKGIVVASVAAGLLAIALIIICLATPLIGFYATTVLSFLSFEPGRILDRPIPVYTSIEIYILLVFLGASWQTRREKGNLWSAPISIAFFCYGIFFLVEFFNPNMDSISGYVLYARKFLMFVFVYVTAYKVLDTKEKVKYFFEFWIIISFVTAIFGCFQQWFGLLPYEMHAILSDPHEYKLLLQGGMIRKFSILSDPVSFGILCGTMSLYSLIMAIHEKGRNRKILYSIITFFLVLGMLYSGTRTTIIILPSGMVLYGLMTLHNRRTLIIVFSFFTISTAVLLAPIDSPALNRMRSSLNLKEASLDVRTVHRKYIQPYIHYHPLGGGIATSGVDGIRFNPHHVLAGFPPDSGLLKYAIETGWIGYALVMAFFFIILVQGINYYFLATDPEMKLYLLALTVTLFTIIISQYAQVSLGQIPGVLFFYSGLAILKRLLEFSNGNENEINVET